MRYQRYLALLTLACASCTPVPAVAIDLEGDKIVATPEERHTLTQCHRHGGCFVFTGVEIATALQLVHQQTLEAAAAFMAQNIQETRESCRRLGS